MNPLSDIDIESELSYAYLHAVASKAGFACDVKGRHYLPKTQLFTPESLTEVLTRVARREILTYKTP